MMDDYIVSLSHCLIITLSHYLIISLSHCLPLVKIAIISLNLSVLPLSTTQVDQRKGGQEEPVDMFSCPGCSHGGAYVDDDKPHICQVKDKGKYFKTECRACVPCSGSGTE